jgi:hypothetical protein
MKKPMQYEWEELMSMKKPFTKQQKDPICNGKEPMEFSIDAAWNA